MTDMVEALRMAFINHQREQRAEQMAAKFTRALRRTTASRGRPRSRSAVRTRTDVVALMAEARRPRLRASMTGTRTAELSLYGEIGWDLTAEEFLDRLQDIDAGQIVLHINSVGGSVYDGLAIYNGLRDHPARIIVSVDGMAASAASFIAMAGDEISMNRGATMMVHDAMKPTYGNEREHLSSAELLGKVSDTLAAIYASRAGGTAAHWRSLMRAETWFTADEAVAAGLADTAVTDDQAPAAKLDVRLFRTALREALR